MIGRCIAALFITAALAACGQPNASREAEILAAIEGYAISPTQRRGAWLPNASAEMFACGGEWRRLSRPAADPGAFTIEGDRICASDSEGGSCRRFIRVGDRQGETRLYLSGAVGFGEGEYHLRRAAFCAPDPAGGPSRDVSVIEAATLTPLNDSQLRQRLRGTSVTFADSHFIEGYGCAGHWSESGAIVPRHGRYEIADNQVCVIRPSSTGESRSCKRVFERDNITYFEGRDGTAYGVEIRSSERC